MKFNLLLVIFFSAFVMYGQCGLTETITICDMTTIDKDSDGTFDGIINLFDEYNKLNPASPITTGTWFDPGFNFALNEATGDLTLWDLDDSSEAANDYIFELTNTTCSPNVTLTINLILGPFSGYVSANDPNVQICADFFGMCSGGPGYNLDQVLDPLPSAHSNGEWEYIGSSPNFISLEGSFFIACVPYEPGPPLPDQEVFEFLYKVPGISPCAAEVSTRVTVSVVRTINSGNASLTHICEDDLQNGVYDNIDLRDDIYLEGEDIEGVWDTSDPTGQITSPGDSVINLGEVYDNLYATNQRFGCETYGYTYSVDDRSNVCGDLSSTVEFTFYEKIRPFTQKLPIPEFCVGVPSPAFYDLYDALQFVTENGVLYDYPKEACTNWEFISSTSKAKTNLKLVSNVGDLCNLDLDPFYTTKGTIDVSNLTNDDAGSYTFRYTVLADYSCPGNFEFTPPLPPCEDFSIDVTIVVNPYNYAGETTTGLEFCEDDPVVASPLNLLTLLDTNGIDTIYTGAGAKWEDTSGNEITNPFTIPSLKGKGKQTFDFRYITPDTDKGCTDGARLSFTVFEKYNPGTLNVSSPYSVCNTQPAFDLFSLLTNADTNGVWTLPNGSTTSSNTHIFNPDNSAPGTYVYTVPDNEVSNPICPSSSSSITISVVQNSDPGLDAVATVCVYDKIELNLFALVKGTPDSGGSFVDIDGAGNALSGNILSIEKLPSAGVYNFEYEFISPSCPRAFSTVTINVIGTADAGESATVTVCEDVAPFNLFAELGGTPFTTGKWLNADGGTASPNNTFDFNPSIFDEGVFVYTYEVPGISPCDQVETSTVTINVLKVPNAGNNVDVTVCRSVMEIDLEDFIDDTADKNGVFQDTEGTGALSGSMVDLTLLGDKSYKFTYRVDNGSCIVQTAILTVRAIIIDLPVVEAQKFCISDGKTLSDVKVDTPLNYVWYESLTAEIPLPDTTVMQTGKTYYVATQDGDCESDRIKFVPNLLPFNSPGCNICVSTAVSPNGDNNNDSLDFCGLPYVFPNYEFKIFNRYGSVVFEGGHNKPEFKGKSNVSMSLGEDLPTGVYFYIFDPKDGNKTKPFQGNFFLNR